MRAKVVNVKAKGNKALIPTKLLWWSVSTSKHNHSTGWHKFKHQTEEELTCNLHCKFSTFHPKWSPPRPLFPSDQELGRYGDCSLTSRPRALGTNQAFHKGSLNNHSLWTWTNTHFTQWTQHRAGRDRNVCQIRLLLWSTESLQSAMVCMHSPKIHLLKLSGSL